MTARPSPAAAAALSFVLPGLGQVSVGAVRRGVILSVPAVAIVAVAAAARLAGPASLLDLALAPQVLTGLLILNIVLAGYHVFAIVDAERAAVAIEPTPRLAHRSTTVALIALVIATIALHGAAEAVGYGAYVALDDMFGPPGEGGGWAIPDPSFEPDPSGDDAPIITPTASPRPSPTTAATPATSPSPTPASSPTSTPTPPPTVAPSATASPAPGWAKNGRLDLLLIGSDAGPGRWSLRTDTMIVLSVDVATGRSALFGVPRNMTGVPLPPESAHAFANGRFPGLLNALYVYAMGHRSAFPGGDARGFRAVTGAVQELVGVRLDGAVVVDLGGFVRLVDAIGGLWIDVPARLRDRNYPLEDGSGHIRLDIRPGCQLLDGRMALAYARSRHQDSDYGRMRRQQLVLVALRQQLDPVALLPTVPQLLDIAGDHLWTTIDRDAVAGLVALAARVDTDTTERVVFVPPRYPSHVDTATIKRIRKVVRNAFAGPAPVASPVPTEDPDRRCPP